MKATTAAAARRPAQVLVSRRMRPPARQYRRAEGARPFSSLWTAGGAGREKTDAPYSTLLPTVSNRASVVKPELLRGLVRAGRFPARNRRDRLVEGLRRPAQPIADVLAKLAPRLGGQHEPDPGADQQADPERAQRARQPRARRALGLEAQKPEQIVLVHVPHVLEIHRILLCYVRLLALWPLPAARPAPSPSPSASASASPAT